MYLYIPVMYFCCAVAALCVAILLLLQLQRCCLLLLAAAVRHRVPNHAICCCGLLHLIPAFCFSSFKRGLLMYPLAVLSHAQTRFTYNPIIHTIHPRKLQTCAEPRRAAAHTAATPPLYIYIYMRKNGRTSRVVFFYWAAPREGRIC